MKLASLKKKRIIIPAVLVLLAGGLVTRSVLAVGANPSERTVETYPATYGALSNTVDVSGTVGSSRSVYVYAGLTAPVSEVAVKVGDKVQEGDLLCVLDTTDLEMDVAQSAASLSITQSKASHSLTLAQKELQEEQYNNKNDYNSQLLSGQSSVDNAEQTLKTAENAVKSAEQTVKTAETTVRKASLDARNARTDLRDIRDDNKVLDDDEYYDDALTRAKRTSAQADLDLESAQISLENAKVALANAKIDLESAKLGLESAESSLRATEEQAKQSESAAADRVTTARLNADLSDQQIGLEKLRQDLEKGAVTAPASGTVTAVYAQEGAPSSGLLVVIEDTDNLIVTANIREYDIAGVGVGMPVKIRADGTGSEEYEGSVARIAPTTLKNETGETISTTGAEFETEIQVSGKTGLLIGMNARLNIVTEEKENILSVPVEALVVDEEGGEAIFILQEQPDGTTIAKKVLITTGMETDFFCEVTGDELSEGDEVILSPSGLVDGEQVIRMDEEMLQQAMMA